MATRHVSLSGNNGNPGTEGSPYATIAYGVAQSYAGDTLIIGAGIFNEWVFSSRSGSAGNPITIQGAAGATVGAFALTHSYITLKDMTIVGYSGAAMGINIAISCDSIVCDNLVFESFAAGKAQLVMSHLDKGNRPTNCQVLNCEFYDTDYYALSVHGRYHLVEGCYFTTPNGGDAMYLHARDTIIRGNTWENWDRPEGSLAHTDLIQAFSNNGEISQDNLIEKNLFKNCSGTQLGNFTDDGDVGRISRWTFRNNIWWNVEAQASITCDEFKFYNNVFVDCGRNGAGPLLFRQNGTGAGNSSNCEVINNIFLNCGNDPTSTNVGWYGFSGASAGFVGNYNLVRGTGAGAVKSGFTNGGREANGINGSDPLFVDEAAGNFRLSAGSPGIDAGFDLSAYVTDDFDGNSRGVVFDLGAYTYDPSADTTPPTPNPSTIASVTVNSTTQITVVADTATDAVSSPVEYNHSIGGVFQGWQSSATRVFTGLLPGTLYSFTVRARDSAGNATTASVASTATTDASQTTTPNPLAFRSNAMLGMGAF